MKRLLITSYQKSGTHQVYPMVMPISPQIIDYGDIQFIGFRDQKRPLPGYKDTVTALRNFTDKSFGHIPFHPEYAEALRAQPTIVLFNVRDPRDVIVSEWETIKRDHPMGWMNLYFPEYKSRLRFTPDPLALLIELAAIRWPHWIDWLDQDFTIKVRYEDLRLTPDSEIPRIYHALAGCSIPTLAIMRKKVKPNQENPTFRKGAVGEYKTYFQPHHHEMAEELLGPILETLGYD